MIKRILIVGGSNGIGLSMAINLALRDSVEKIYIVDKEPLSSQYSDPKIEPFVFDLKEKDYSFFDRFNDINALMITAGFGKLSLFRDIQESYIIDSFDVNTISAIRLIKRFYDKLESHKDYYCGIMVSIAGFMSSPFWAVYGATKAALKVFIESVNVELIKSGSDNRILNVSPGSIKGTSFYSDNTNLEMISSLTEQIINNLEAKNDLFIPQYEEIFKYVLERYHEDFRLEGQRSYDYKIMSGRLKDAGRK